MNNIDPFSGEPILVVGEDNPLYGYYDLIKKPRLIIKQGY